jgi:hypothetical protein
VPSIKEQVKGHAYRPSAPIALRWLKDRVGLFGSQTMRTPADITKATLVTPETAPFGMFYLFAYWTPNYPQRLPYVDRFPLVLYLKRNRHYYLGLNFHYMPMQLRQQAFDLLYPFMKPFPPRENTKVQASWMIARKLSRMPIYRPMVHTYRRDRFKSMWLPVAPAEWPVALHLPVADFRPEAIQDVWNDSRKIMERTQKK